MPKTDPSTDQVAARAPRREHLNRDKVLRAALTLADDGGLESLSMRRVAQELAVEAMALYRHVANKDDMVDGIVDLVFAEIELPTRGPDWKSAMRQRSIAVRDALTRHRWAIGLMESRRHPGPANLRHHDAVIGSLRAGGLAIAMAAHAYALLDAYVYGFALTKLNLPFETSADIGEVAAGMLAPFPKNEYPYMLEILTEHVMKPGYDFGEEFEFGLEVVLDGIEQAQDGAARH